MTSRAAELSMPYPQAYGKYRQGEALVATDRPQAADLLAGAAAIAGRLGAVPLGERIDQLRRRARLSVRASRPDTEPS